MARTKNTMCRICGMDADPKVYASDLLVATDKESHVHIHCLRLLGREAYNSGFRIKIENHQFTILRPMSILDHPKMLEELSALEHEQWRGWAVEISSHEHGISQERRNRWSKCCVPYEDLSEKIKEEDRKFARKVIETIKSFMSH